MSAFKATLATLQGAGFSYGLGEVTQVGRQLVVRFSNGVDAVDIPLNKGDRGEEPVWNGTKLTWAIPVTTFESGMDGHQTLAIAEFVGGDPSGVGVLAFRSTALRFDEFEPIATFVDCGPDTGLIWPGGEGISLPRLQVGRRYASSQHQVFVFAEGQSIIVVDSQQRAGHVRYLDGAFSLRQLTQTDIHHHVIGKALICEKSREARWCLNVLGVIGMKSCGGAFIRAKLEALLRDEQRVERMQKLE